ncbi:MAG: hypothetical protein AAGF57_08315 [Pseudomonadota bacterium]
MAAPSEVHDHGIRYLSAIAYIDNYATVALQDASALKAAAGKRRHAFKKASIVHQLALINADTIRARHP